MLIVTTIFYGVVVMNATAPVITRCSKKPMPTKFKPADEAILEAAHTATGMPKTELIRRSVRLMGQQQALRKDYGFLLPLTA